MILKTSSSAEYRLFIGLFCKRDLSFFYRALWKRCEILYGKRYWIVWYRYQIDLCLKTSSSAEYRLFYRALLQKRPIIHWIVWYRYQLDLCLKTCARKLTKTFESLWKATYHLKNYGSFLQKSPIKETIFCRRGSFQAQRHILILVTGLFCKRAL